MLKNNDFKKLRNPLLSVQLQAKISHKEIRVLLQSFVNWKVALIMGARSLLVNQKEESNEDTFAVCRG
jgi:hypothetical protein